MSENSTENDDNQAEFDPANHNIDEINEYLEENPDELQRVLKAEQDGKNRSTLVSALQEQVDGIPQPVEPAAVTVAPAAAPGLLDQFEVTPERGYRKK